MEKREDRRDRTVRYAERARSTHARCCGRPVEQERPVGYFAKRKSNGCNCSRRRVGCAGSPKVAGGWCHGAGYEYHPSTQARIAGKRLAHEWLTAVRSGTDPDDVSL